MKFGFNSNFVQFNQPYFNNQRGTVPHRRPPHRQLDRPTCSSAGSQRATRQLGFNRNYWRQHALGAFFNDDWKVYPQADDEPGLPLGGQPRALGQVRPAGRRTTPTRCKLVIANDENAPANYQELLDHAGVRDVVTTAGAVGLARSVVKTDWINLSPRVGLAYRVNDKTVIRSGYGIFLAGDILNNLRNNLSNQFPFAINQTLRRRKQQPESGVLPDAIPGAREIFTGTTDGQRLHDGPATGLPAVVELHHRAPTARRNGARDGLPRLEGHAPAAALRLQPAVPRPRLATSSGEGFQRPIPEWNAINIFSTSANSIYNAFNASWRKRSRGGLFWRINYS